MHPVPSSPSSNRLRAQMVCVSPVSGHTSETRSGLFWEGGFVRCVKTDDTRLARAELVGEVDISGRYPLFPSCEKD